MGVGILLFNDAGDLLLVKPSYKDHWSLPGGVVDVHESPQSACIREVKEEIGIDIPIPRFACVAYYDNTDNVKGECLQFMFDGGTLTQADIENIKIAPKEIEAFQFIPIIQAINLVSTSTAKRIPRAMEAIKSGTALYLEEAS